MSDEWTTPADVFAAIDRAYGPFGLDAASTASNAKAPVFYTAEDDGFSQPWSGRVWCNPPYSQTRLWTEKAAAEVQAGNADVVVLLVPANGAQWWQRAIAAGAHSVYWPRRISFGDGTGRPTFNSGMLVFGDVPRLVTAICLNCDTVFLSRCGAITCSARCRKALSRAA